MCASRQEAYKLDPPWGVEVYRWRMGAEVRSRCSAGPSRVLVTGQDWNARRALLIHTAENRATFLAVGKPWRLQAPRVEQLLDLS